MSLKHASCRAVALAALLAGAAPAALFAETPADTLVLADAIDDIVSIDPHEAFEFSGLDLVNNVYDSLIELDPTKPGEMVPGLAESWSVSEDGMTYSFKMKSGVTFASGNPVTAEDAAFSLRRVVKINKTPAFIMAQFGFTPENVEEMITFEGDTVTIKTDKVYAPSFFYNCLTAAVGNIVDMKTVMANEVDGDMGNNWLKSNSAGTGAYVLKSFKAGEGYILEAREGHWRGDAKLKNVFMQHIPEGATERLLLEKGDIDIARALTPTDVAGLEGNADVAISNDNGGQIYYLAANQKNEALANPAVLDAMRWAVDYQGMADTILKGQWAVHQAFLPKGFLGAIEDTPYSLDIEKAKALLAESGVELPLKISLTVRNNQERMDIAQSVQNTFAQAGIELSLDVGDGATVLDKYRARQHELTLQTWGPDYPDPHTNASTFAINPDNSDEAKLTGYLAWRTAWDPGAMSAETEAAVAEMDEAKRVEMYRSIQERHRDDSAFILMFGQLQQTGARANVQGFHTGGAVDSASYWLVTK
ncbi:ABC transporter substrate-binding protein [Xinfangfangia sp. CPCC 101601]|uniref:ABC transporter substrate-binding protein n=1 Tax=Pseudogemmobacter lacusdianii TaxID=3069608 RepID=A0ABU0VWK2_9RHOB|nr:ABC transporter substrate-binding protein [Xinfangfangia sp. CPCC 101601]MDQ2066136.1 ABC transporter substrate-binding protein [Xinfangfangia sp. CPCC 101601]